MSSRDSSWTFYDTTGTTSPSPSPLSTGNTAYPNYDTVTYGISSSSQSTTVNFQSDEWNVSRTSSSSRVKSSPPPSSSLFFAGGYE